MKKFLIYIACILWIIDVIYLFSFVQYDYQQINKARIFITYITLGIIPLLLMILASKPSVKKDDNSNPKYKRFTNNFNKKVTGYIRSRIHSGVHKILKIGYSLKISPQITKSYNSANNDALHGDNLTRYKEYVNHKQTEPLIVMSKRIIKRYRIKPTNSTVCGYAGIRFDWSKFDWDGQTEHDFGDMRYSTESEFVPVEQRGQLIGVNKAPMPCIDGNDLEYYNYIHVPYNYADDAVIYRVRPHYAVGQKRWGYTVKRVTAVKDNGIWYWEIELTNKTK